MLGWVVVTEKLVAVPVVLQTTPAEPVKPGSPLHAREARYGSVSTKYASWAVAALRASDATRALKPRDRYAENCGIAIAARMPMMATTTSSSISVKPLDFFRFVLETLRILSPLAGWVLVCLDPCRDALGRCWPLEASEVPRGERTAWRNDGAKSRRFAARTDVAASALRVRACPPIGTKLTPGTIPSPAQRKAHIEGQLEGRARWSAGGGIASGRPGVVGGRFGVAHAVTESLGDLPRRRPHHRPRSAFTRPPEHATSPHHLDRSRW